MKTRLAVVLVLLLAGLAGSRLFFSLGNILHHEDPLAAADVIFVLGGTRIERIAEAGELYIEGWAPRVLLSRQVLEPAERRLRARGVTIPSETDLQRDVLVEMGVPPAAIDSLDDGQVSTASEIDELAALAPRRGWRRVIVVTSKLHTARARLALQREFDDSGIATLVRASRYDASDVERWWSNRDDLRFALFESQKLMAYWLGIAD